ncbi:MAG: hypothetical protein BGO70_09570 [Bacteroidetes bacterium 43-93]|nr:ABC transporter [Bacteroidota bacterium]OJX00408.1 MAG: hypothetical protein BGO70_09570 [Bacteroidetes bacterium 43-93]
MKKLLIYTLTVLLIAGCSRSKSKLYKETDSFVESLSTTYESYGLFGGTEHSKTTEDGKYKITPIGRLINVKIMEAAGDGEYEDLKDDLEGHYKGDARVNKVYICQAGTIMIDCRD